MAEGSHPVTMLVNAPFPNPQDAPADNLQHSSVHGTLDEKGCEPIALRTRLTYRNI